MRKVITANIKGTLNPITATGKFCTKCSQFYSSNLMYCPNCKASRGKTQNEAKNKGSN